MLGVLLPREKPVSCVGQLLGGEVVVPRPSHPHFADSRPVHSRLHRPRPNAPWATLGPRLRPFQSGSRAPRSRAMQVCERERQRVNDARCVEQRFCAVCSSYSTVLRNSSEFLLYLYHEVLTVA